YSKKSFRSVGIAPGVAGGATPGISIAQPPDRCKDERRLSQDERIRMRRVHSSHIHGASPALAGGRTPGDRKTVPSRYKVMPYGTGTARGKSLEGGPDHVGLGAPCSPGARAR